MANISAEAHVSTDRKPWLNGLCISCKRFSAKDHPIRMHIKLPGLSTHSTLKSARVEDGLRKA